MHRKEIKTENRKTVASKPVWIMKFVTARSCNSKDKHMKLCTCIYEIHYNGHNQTLLNPSKTLIKYKMV